jgi:CubicO group peptidase (beta-lactamase class C family)
MNFEDLPDALLVSYQDNELAEEVAAEAIYGGIAIKGKLPVSINPWFTTGDGLETTDTRLSITDPENLQIKTEYIQKADSIAMSGILQKAYPGCQVIAVKDGQIFYNKVFGYHTYDRTEAVKKTDLYDLASVTKIAATGLALMDLYGKSEIDIDQCLSKYLPYLKSTDKKDIIIREMMAHQSRLRAWIPYFKYTIDDSIREQVYATKISEDHPVRVAEGMYIFRDYDVFIFDSIRFSGLRNSSYYKYSDLGFYLMKEAIEGIQNRPFEQFVEERYYAPLGLPTMGYLPLKRFSRDCIVPTEDDKIFRKQLLLGDVHDQGAAMLGGVSGHAGLFSNAFDLAVIMQMLLDQGEYGGQKYLEGEVVREFTKTQFPLNQNRRGIGFDKPMLEYDEDGPTCKSVSPKSFGHSGFTGTYAWADPENGLIYVFLSNRIYPDAGNTRIMDLDIRTNLHQVFYDALSDRK